MPRMSRRINHEAQQRALDVVSLSRRWDIPMSAAAAHLHVDPRTVARYAADAFELRAGRYYAKPRDRLGVWMQVMTPRGPRWVMTRDSRHRKALSDQAYAIRRYSDWGDYSFMEDLGGSTVTIEGQTYRLRLETWELDRLIEGAELHYELYAR